MSFFLQGEILGWLKVVKSDIVLCDNDSIRLLLNMPIYNPSHLRLPAHMMQSPVAVAVSGGASARRRPPERVLPSPSHPDANPPPSSALTYQQSAAGDAKTKVRAVSVDRSNVLQEMLPTVDILSGPNPSPVDAVAAEWVAEGYENDADLVSEDGMFKGRRINNLVFLDQSPSARALYHDCSYSHSFKVRGANYLVDKKKVHLFTIQISSC